MDSIIQKFNFLQATDDMKDAFEKQLEKWKNDNKEKINTEMVKKCLDSAMTKVCIGDFPGEDTEPGAVAKIVFDQVFSIMSDLVDEGKVQVVEMHDLLLECMRQLLASGPGTTQIAIITQIVKFSDFLEYTGALEGEKLNKYLNVLKREYVTQEKITPKDYASKLESVLQDVVDFGFESDQVKGNLTMFLEFFVYFETSTFPNSTTDVVAVMRQVADWIDYKANRKMFKKIKDPTQIKEVIGHYQAVICDKTFPTDSNHLKRVKSSLENFLGGLNASLQFEAVCDVFMDFCVAIFDKPGEKIPVIVEVVGDFFYHINKKAVKDKAAVFDCVIKKTMLILKKMDPVYADIRFVNGISSDILVLAMNNSSKEHASLMVDFIKACIVIPNKSHLEAAYCVMHDKEANIKWKDHLNSAKEIFKIISKTEIPEGKKQKKTAEVLVSFTESFLNSVKNSRATADLIDGMSYFVIGVLEARTVLLFPLGANVAESLEYNVKINKNLMMELFRRLKPLLDDDAFPWFDEEFLAFSITSHLVSALTDGINNSKILSMEDLDLLIEIVCMVIGKEFNDPNTGETNSIYFIIYITLGTSLLTWLVAVNEMGRASSLISAIINLMENTEDLISSTAASHIQLISEKSGKHIASHLDSVIKIFIEKEKVQTLVLINAVYEYNPKALVPHFQKIFSHIYSRDQGCKTSITMLLQKVAIKQPELFTEKNVSEIIKESLEDSQYQSHLLQIIESVSQKYPDNVSSHLQDLIKFELFDKSSTSILIAVIKNVGQASQKYCGTVLDHFSKALRNTTDEMTAMMIIDGIKTVGSKHKAELAKHRKTLEDVRKQTTIHAVKEACQQIIDYLEDRSLEGLSANIQQQQSGLNVLDTKITDTKKKVKVVEDDMKNQTEEMNVVKKDVQQKGKKIEQLDKTVQETVVKVQEIDSKTLGHAPFWSKDVSKLLNPKDKHDWRLLCSRLGYSNADIRAWAQQADPCMAMLNEWYTTHKTSEASFAILKHLQELNRMDAAIIVENAMKMAETVVEDEEFEYVSPPQIFISYQWGYQNEVKVLAKHLEMAGFSCWLDIGQMGGGDKLFEKIDNGIRAAKVVISCVTENYAKSPNCNREVNLAVNLGKFLIPLLMEKTPWPPQGSMGPIFSEYLFIRFFTRAGESTQDDRYWPPAKFQELLMQLSLNSVDRNEQTVSPQYKNWWMPVEESVVVDKKRNKDISNTVAVVDTKVDGVFPDVFISYQWGKQKQIISLYKRLTEMSISCFMDIHQMGGGDSLYDKIDRGIHGCKLVLSCITTKYVLSANCRKEVSLAEAIKKPIIPLLLESITWPPAGPMSMAFSHLLYIDCVKDENVQDKWIGPVFDKLVAKIREIISDTQTPVAKKKVPTNSSTLSASSKSQSSQNVIPKSGTAAAKSTTQMNKVTAGPKPSPLQARRSSVPKPLASQVTPKRAAVAPLSKTKEDVLKSTNLKLKQSATPKQTSQVKSKVGVTKSSQKK